MTTLQKGLRFKTFQRTIGTVRVTGGKLHILGNTSPSSNEEYLNLVAGLGDGVYEVVATFKHVNGVGPRISDVSVKFFDDAELSWMEKEASEN